MTAQFNREFDFSSINLKAIDFDLLQLDRRWVSYVEFDWGKIEL